MGGARIAGIAITHQRETFVCLDQSGVPIRPAITWMDVRATREVDEYGTPRVHRITGKPPNPTPAWYKLLWINRHEPATIARMAKVVDVAGFLVHKLTGEWATSWASADPLGLVDLQLFDYDDELLAMAGFSRAQLSRLLSPGAVAGVLLAPLAAELGLAPGLPVVVSAGDGQSAGLGCNVTRPGRAYLNLGSGIVAGIHADHYSYHTAYRTMSGPLPGTYILETFIGGGTQNILWLVKQLGLTEQKGNSAKSSQQLLEDAAGAAPVGSLGLMCLPYWTGAMTPFWDGHARGAFIGLSGVHTKAHMYRAALEGMALEQRCLIEGVETATGTKIEEILMLGGGSRSPLWRQIIADVLGRPVKLVREQESTSLGAGIHASAALGLHDSLHTAAEAMTGIETVYTPDPGAHQSYTRFYEAYRSIYPGLKQTFRLLAEASS